MITSLGSFEEIGKTQEELDNAVKTDISNIGMKQVSKELQNLGINGGLTEDSKEIPGNNNEDSNKAKIELKTPKVKIQTFGI